MKRCTKCGHEKSLGEFSPDSSRRDGLSSRCKTCKAALESARRNRIGLNVIAAQQRAAHHALPEYKILSNIVQRCTNRNNPGYERYGGRGITVAPEWTGGQEGLDRFLAHIGRRPSPELSVERKENDKGYVPGNVIWATRAVQSRNTCRTHKITFRGVTLCLTDWAAKAGITRSALKQRLKFGWPIDKALTTPMRRSA